MQQPVNVEALRVELAQLEAWAECARSLRPALAGRAARRLARSRRRLERFEGGAFPCVKTK